MSKHFLLGIILLSFKLALTAQGLFESASAEAGQEDFSLSLPVISGYVKGSAWGCSEDYNYSNIFGEFSIQGKISSGKTFLKGDIRVREGFFFNERNTIVQLKEAYGGFTGNKLDIFIGNQILSWGRTDGFNPTNNINPNDYFFLTSDPDDQVMANFMFTAKYRFSPQTELETVIIPVYKPSGYRYDLFNMGESASFISAVLPEAKFSNSAFAARLNMDLPAAGFSFSWFHGFDPFYGFKINNVQLLPERQIIYQPDFYLKNTLGLDLALPVNTWIIRTEAALNMTQGDTDKIFIPNPDIYYVIGIEHDFAGFLSILQYIGKNTFNFNSLEIPVLSNPLDPLAQLQYAEEMIGYESALFNRKIFHQQENQNHAFMFSVNKPFFYDELKTEISVYYNITSEEYLYRAKLTWNISDGISMDCGASFMQGPENSVFNRAGKVLNGIFTGIKVSF